MMKKLLLICLCALSGTTAFAQFANASFGGSSSSEVFWSNEGPEKVTTAGFHAGLNVSNFSCSSRYDYLKSALGFDAGVDIEHAIRKNLAIKWGVEFTRKGAKYTNKYSLDTYKHESEKTVYPYYIQLPVMASYKIRPSKKFQVFVDFGFYMAVGIFGNDTYILKGYNANGELVGKYTREIGLFGSNVIKSTFPEVPNWQDSNKEYEDDIFNRFDAGLKFGAGIGYGIFRLGIHYELGLANIMSDKYSNTTTANNRNLAITAGLMF